MHRALKVDLQMSNVILSYNLIYTCTSAMLQKVSDHSYNIVNGNNQFCVYIQKKRPGIPLDDFILHQDNAPPYRAQMTTHEIGIFGFKTIRHPPYTPDLAPMDFAIFPTVKTAQDNAVLFSAEISSGYKPDCRTIWTAVVRGRVRTAEPSLLCRVQRTLF